MPVAPATQPLPANGPLRTASSDRDLGFSVGGNVSVGASVPGVGEVTNSRVAGVLLVSAAVLAALKLLGFRFNVGVS